TLTGARRCMQTAGWYKNCDLGDCTVLMARWRPLTRRTETMPQKVKDRPYDSDDLREVMYTVGGWAQGWDDVLWYLKAVAPHDPELFRREHVQGLLSDVEHLRRTGARFSTDHHEVYKQITGLECQSCRP